MKKNLTKKLMLSVLTLAFAVVSLGASTFAWFTTSDTATISPVKGQVIGGNGIEVAVGTIDGKESSEYYVNNLPTATLNKYILAPVADDDATKDYVGAFKEFTHASLLKDSTTEPDWKKTVALYNATKAGVPASDPANYIAFKLYVRVESAGTLTLTNVYAKNITEKLEAWVPGVSYKKSETDTEGVDAAANVKYDILSSLRIAVVNPQVEGADGFGDNAAVTPVIYEQGDAVKEGCLANTKGYSNFGAYQIYNLKNVTSPLTLLDKDVPSTGYKTFNQDDKAENLTEVYCTVTADTVYSFDVYLWIEGYDAECVNAIFAQQIEFGFNFGWEGPTGASN